MPHWNYRVKREKIDADGVEYTWHIIEVHYDNQGNIESYSDPITPYGESMTELRGDIELMSKAFRRPDVEEINGELVEV